LPALEAGVAVIWGRVRENFSMPFPIDAYYDVIIMPGFSDTHAHPQVIDAGLQPVMRWENSYHWIETRQLNVDEARVRADIGLASRLAELVMKRALLEGTTLIALTGRFEANLKAFVRMESTPRVVLLPTVMNRKGWATPESLKTSFSRLRKYMRDQLLRIGVFLHSLAYGGPKMTVEALELARSLRGPLGIHLSEGVSERRDFEEITCCRRENVSIVAVHCLNDNYRDLGLRCSSCPASNILLYGRVLGDISRITSFGSDWPHLVGTTGRLIPLMFKLYRGRTTDILLRATVGGYEDYGVSAFGDFIAYDGSLRRVLEGLERPKLVSVARKIVVEEGILRDTEESLEDVERETRETIKYAVEIYGTGIVPWIPTYEELLDYASKLASRNSERGVRKAKLGI
jgi:guanine deaminase